MTFYAASVRIRTSSDSRGGGRQPDLRTTQLESRLRPRPSLRRTAVPRQRQKSDDGGNSARSSVVRRSAIHLPALDLCRVPTRTRARVAPVAPVAPDKPVATPTGARRVQRGHPPAVAARARRPRAEWRRARGHLDPLHRPAAATANADVDLPHMAQQPGPVAPLAGALWLVRIASTPDTVEPEIELRAGQLPAHPVGQEELALERLEPCCEALLVEIALADVDFIVPRRSLLNEKRDR